MSVPQIKTTKSRLNEIFTKNKEASAGRFRVNTTASGGTQVISSDPTAASSSSTVVNDPTGSKPGTDPHGTSTNVGNPQGLGPKPMANTSWEKAGSGARRTHEQAFGKDPITQYREAKAGRKIKKQQIRDKYKAKTKEDIKRSETLGGYDPNTGWADENAYIGVRMKKRKLNRLEKRKEMKSMNSPMNYLNPNTLGVEGDAGQMDDQQQPVPNRAGRPVNSNVLMNDPMNYQDPSKIPASQNATEQLFSGLAQSMGNTNPEPMIPGQDPNQSITPGQQSPFNMEDLSGDGKITKKDVLIGRGVIDSPAKKKNWIQDVNKDIERRGTKGVCTGDKFGSESCPPGSKRYNLAKTFRKMNKK